MPTMTIEKHMELSGVPYEVSNALPFVVCSGSPFVAVAVYTWGGTQKTFAGFYNEKNSALSALRAAGQHRGVSTYVVEVTKVKG